MLQLLLHGVERLMSLGHACPACPRLVYLVAGLRGSGYELRLFSFVSGFCLLCHVKGWIYQSWARALAVLQGHGFWQEGFHFSLA